MIRHGIFYTTEEFSLSQVSERSVFVASWSEHPGADIASQLARALKYGWSGKSMVLQAQGCQLIDTHDTIGIESITCKISPGSLLTINATDGGKKKIRLKGGILGYYRNIYYTGPTSLSLTLTTEAGYTVSASRTLSADSCYDAEPNGFEGEGLTDAKNLRELLFKTNQFNR